MATCLQCGAPLEPEAASCVACGLPGPGKPLVSQAAPGSSEAFGTPTAESQAQLPAGRAAVIAIASIVGVAAGILFVVLLFRMPPTQSREAIVTPPPAPRQWGEPKVVTPPTKPEPTDSGVGIATPAPGSALRQQLMDRAHEVLEIREPFIVEHLAVQGPRAVGIVKPQGSSARYVLAWELMPDTGGAWDVIYNGEVGDGSAAALEDPSLGLSAELRDELGL